MDRERFTPTCVGSALSPPGSARSGPVHPHVRGERGPSGRLPHTPVGSPPRAWGALYSPRSRLLKARFTPTCVGSASRSGCSPGTSTVHPHVRGERVTARAKSSYLYGSPPRAWGARRLYGSNSLTGPVHPHVRGERDLGEGPGIRALRFTPTCVGSAKGASRRRGSLPVHPHVRGERPVASSSMVQLIGSPPRAWGARGGRHVLRRRVRFTPTCVGSATATACPTTAVSVHPHVRGERVGRHDASGQNNGSPPRAWGARRSRVLHFRLQRFTPTCVGSARRRWQVVLALSVHPHVRGERQCSDIAWAIQTGSPPRAWGAQIVSHLSRLPLRFTPTCVGSALRSSENLYYWPRPWGFCGCCPLPPGLWLS